MTFSFTSPPANDKDRVRFHSGDKTQKWYSIQDEDILYALSAEMFNSDVIQAAAWVCRQIGDQLASTANKQKQVGPYRTMSDATEGAESWYKKAIRLLAGGISGAIGAPIFTGPTDALPTFRKGMHDNSNTGWDDGTMTQDGTFYV